MTEKRTIDNYNKLVNRQQQLVDQASNLVRERDYRVQRIERKYNAELEVILREQDAVALQIEVAKRYVALTDAPITRKLNKTVEKKERN
jgi:uncharacterized protein (DUF1778 family)